MIAPEPRRMNLADRLVASVLGLVFGSLAIGAFAVALLSIATLIVVLVRFLGALL